jgi:hypothetical protein
MTNRRLPLSQRDAVKSSADNVTCRSLMVAAICTRKPDVSNVRRLTLLYILGFLFR